MHTAADLVERSVSADLLRLPGHPLAEDPHQQPTRADHERNPSADAGCRSISGRPVLSEPGFSTAALHRRHSLVRQMLHEHAAALSAASPANRSRRLIKCAKESARYRLTIVGAVTQPIHLRAKPCH